MKHEFCGWYFKCQSGAQTLSLIPAIHTHNNIQTCSIQLISQTGNWNADLPTEGSHLSWRKPLARLGSCIFSPTGIHLDLQTPQCQAWGEVRFHAPSPIRYDIMGPFALVPFLECRHRVFSMRHHVSGKLVVNGTAYHFFDGVGYIEGDRGRSFPRHYAWSQCFFSEGSLMLSVAEIPLGPACFTGVIAVVQLGDAEFRLATYLGATVTLENRQITIRQGRLTLTAVLLEKTAQMLHAPANGAMSRTIRENAACLAYYRLLFDGRRLLEFESRQASFEYEYPF